MDVAFEILQVQDKASGTFNPTYELLMNLILGHDIDIHSISLSSKRVDKPKQLSNPMLLILFKNVDECVSDPPK